MTTPSVSHSGAVTGIAGEATTIAPHPSKPVTKAVTVFRYGDSLSNWSGLFAFIYQSNTSLAISSISCAVSYGSNALRGTA